MTEAHGIRVRRLRLVGIARNYDIDFTTEGRVRDLSVISGAFSSGKTAVLEFVAYCLGAKNHPRHPEVLRKVRSALLEVELSGDSHIIERAVGEPSTVAFVRQGRLDQPSFSTIEKKIIAPAGDPQSLSSLLLSHCKLEGVELREAPTNAESRTDPLSIRDLMWLTFLPNERVADKNFLFENSPPRKHKLRQVVDVVFGVHDDRAVELGSRIKQLEGRLNRSQAELAAATAFVAEQDGETATDPQTRLTAEAQLTAITAQLEELDQQAHAATSFAEELRQTHRRSAEEARTGSAVLRDRETQLARMLPLRAQYADDLLKLGMLAQARQLFDPLRVRTCPACLNRLSVPPHVLDGHCSMCDHDLPEMPGLTLGAAADNSISAQAEQLDVAAEIRSTKARLKEITTYIEELDASLSSARQRAQTASLEEQRAAKALDEATSPTVSTFLVARDELHRRREAVTRQIDQLNTAFKLQEGLAKRAGVVNRQEANLSQLREELAQLGDATQDRNEVLRQISTRFGRLLAEWHYPKLSQAHMANDLTPFVRGEPYQVASSGARTLITLAWQLAVFETAYESGAAHPGFLMIDSPQKNLGHGTGRDTLIADAVSTDDFYRHLTQWLAHHGNGAQVIVADNSPPELIEDRVIVRFSRDETEPPYGLIDDETG
ncbi:DNA recombination protein RecN [Streptomyces sp. NPDC046866]|uniref:DNA recombination protein RecN n=1 Tax=Streptomyces sp. NPDC046866 TaxID=3154921 RepID=UPI00345368E8